MFCFFFGPAAHRVLHSFPTRRSSDLREAGLRSIWRHYIGPARRNENYPALPHARRSDRKTHIDRKSTRLNSSHGYISYAVFCLKKKTAKLVRRTHSRYSSTHGKDTPL